MNTKYLVLFLSAVFFAVSCDKVVEKEVPAPQEESTEVIIHASLVGNGDTKTVLQENGAVYWQPGDQIAVFFNSVKVPFTSYNSVNAASAYFVGNMDITTAHNEESDGSLAGEYVYWGLYPFYSSIISDKNLGSRFYYDHDVFWVDYMEQNFEAYYENYVYYFSPSRCSGQVVSTILVDWQRGLDNTFDTLLNIALAKSDDYHELSFYNVLGGIRFTVHSPDITRVTFKGNNSEKLAGLFSVKMDDNGKPLITEVPISCETITLSLENNEAFTPGEWYYMMMFPGVLSKGYTMEFYKADAMAKKVVNSSVEVKRSVFGSLQNPDEDLTFDPIIHAASLNIQNDNYAINLVPGETVQVSVTLSPSDCTFPLRWSSTNPEVATVDQNGVITAVAEGDARIFVSCDELADHIGVSVGSTSSNSSFEIVSVDLSGADALARMPMPNDVIDYYRSQYSSDDPTCIYKIDEDGNAEPLKFIFSSSSDVLEQKLNESAMVSGELYWMTEQYIYIKNARVYCLSAYGNSSQSYGEESCFAIRRADNTIVLIMKSNHQGFESGLGSHWYTQRLSGKFRWSFDNTYLYSTSYTYSANPFYRFVQSGNKLVAESLLDFSSSTFRLDHPIIILDKDNNLAYINENIGAYVFFADGGMADFPAIEKTGRDFLFVENSYNWYLFICNNGITVYQVVLNGHEISYVEIATNEGVALDDFGYFNLLKNDDVIIYFNRYTNVKLTFNLQTNELLYTSLPEGFLAYHDAQYNAFGIGYTLADGVLTEYDLINETIRTIDTDRSQVPQMTATTPTYDSSNNCFYETATRYSDTKTITVVTNCDTGKVTVYEGAYDSIFKSYLKL